MMSFEQYDKENPQIWQAFVHFSVLTRKKGFKNYSAKSIFEIIRWHTGVKNADKNFKINNNYTADYARKMMREYPDDFDGFFRTRELRVARKKIIVAAKDIFCTFTIARSTLQMSFLVGKNRKIPSIEKYLGFFVTLQVSSRKQIQIKQNETN